MHGERCDYSSTPNAQFGNRDRRERDVIDESLLSAMGPAGFGRHHEQTWIVTGNNLLEDFEHIVEHFISSILPAQLCTDVALINSRGGMEVMTAVLKELNLWGMSNEWRGPFFLVHTKRSKHRPLRSNQSTTWLRTQRN